MHPITTLDLSHFDFVHQRTRDYMHQANIDALVLTKAEDIYYFTAIPSFFSYQFSPSPAAIFVLYRDPKISSTLILNEFEAATTQIHLPNTELYTFPVWVDIDDPTNTSLSLSERPINPPVQSMLILLQKALKASALSSGTIGIDFSTLTQLHYNLFDTHLDNYQCIDIKSLLNQVRMLKSKTEIQLLKRAAQITEWGINKASSTLDIGVSHADLVHAYQQAIYQFRDTQRSRFHIISIAEHFSPMLHPTQIKAQLGDLVKFDCGVEVHGYGADLARTVILGEPAKDIARIYDIILESHLAMLDDIKPGLSMSKLFDDSIMRIRKLGLAKYNRGHFGHSTGVSLALEEYPFISHDSTAKFEPNMVMCLETPYYGKGVGAMMIEDMVCITNSGVELLSHHPRELTVIHPSNR